MIIQWPDKSLNKVSVPVKDISIHASLIEEMKTLVRFRHAWGLSAVQVGVHERFCVVRYGNETLLLVNPEITKKSKQTCQYNEGCLSLADGKETRVTTRYKQVTVRFHDAAGQGHKLKGTGLLGACLQHEIDHMDGNTINDSKGGFKR